MENRIIMTIVAVLIQNTYGTVGNKIKKLYA